MRSVQNHRTVKGKSQEEAARGRDETLVRRTLAQDLSGGRCGLGLQNGTLLRLRLSLRLRVPHRCLGMAQLAAACDRHRRNCRPQPVISGGGRESNPPKAFRPSTDFEDREGHQPPFASRRSIVVRHSS